jgi:hypothetical protein
VAQWPTLPHRTFTHYKDHLSHCATPISCSHSQQFIVLLGANDSAVPPLSQRYPSFIPSTLPHCRAVCSSHSLNRRYDRSVDGPRRTSCAHFTFLRSSPPYNLINTAHHCSYTPSDVLLITAAADRVDARPVMGPYGEFIVRSIRGRGWSCRCTTCFAWCPSIVLALTTPNVDQVARTTCCCITAELIIAQLCT